MQLNVFFFIVLISMYLKIRGIFRLRVALIVAEWFFILMLILMYILIERICKFGGTLCAAECFFLYGANFYVS